MSKKTDTHELTINGKKCTAFAVADLHPDDLEKHQSELYFWWGNMNDLRRVVLDVINGWYRGHTYDKEAVAAIESDRIEVVTEHVEATVMDALQALVASGGKPVEGWELGQTWGGDIAYNKARLSGVDVQRAGIGLGFLGFDGIYVKPYGYAFRPVTRVRIKAEPKPEPKFKVGDLVEVRAGMPINVPVPFGKVTKVWDTIRGYQYDVNLADGKWIYPFEEYLRPWTPGYGYTLDGNPVPPPPEGWEIVPEGEGIREAGMLFLRGDWRHYSAYAAECDRTAKVKGTENQVRAFARRVSAVLATPEESSGVEVKRVPLTLADFEAMIKWPQVPLWRHCKDMAAIVKVWGEHGIHVRPDGKITRWHDLATILSHHELSFDGGKTWVPASKEVRGE